MQNVGQPFGQGGGAPSHQGAAYGHPESSTTSGSITSSLRQFRKKDVEKQQVSDTAPTVAESHVARVAPHNHYPPRSQDCFRYPSQFPDFSLPTQVKYSEISEHQPLQDQITPSVIQKAKSKEYMEMCNVAQTHMKQSYSDHLNTQQPYAPDPSLHPHAQYLPKDPQVHPSYKPESQYYPPKDNQYQQQVQMQKYNMAAQMRKYPTENDFLSKLRRIHPTMARSIMSDHHLQESQSSYQAMEQNRKYPHQNQRYMNYPSAPMQSNPYPHGYMPSQAYSNYPSSCSYTRNPQMPPRFPSTNPHERSISPRRGYVENLSIPPINYTAVPQRISPNYGQYNPPDYAQHYQHRRPTPQEYFSQPYRTAQYLPHQMVQQEMAENRVTVSDSIKQYIENWADEETATEMNQIEANRLCKENLRIREESSTETVYMINASELQYLENGMPLVASENGIPLVTSENGQYFLKTLDSNTLGMVKIVEKTNQLETSEGAADRIVNLHIMDPLKPDCMMSGKPNELNQRQSNSSEKSRVVIHQNTVIQPGLTSQQCQPKVGSSLPVLVENEVSEDMNHLEKLAENVFRECKKETVDKNCSPINMEHIENMDDFNDGTSVICPLKLLEHDAEEIKEETSENSNGIDPKLKNMPIIDLLPDCLQNVPEENEFTDKKPSSFQVDQKEEKQNCRNTVPEHDAIGLIVENTDNEIFSNKDETIKNEDAQVANSTNSTEFKEIKTMEKVENEINQRSKNIEITKTETKEELTTDCTKDVTNEEPISGDNIEENEVFKNDVPECNVEAVKTDIKDNEMSNIEETKCTFKNSDPVKEKKSTDLLVSGQTSTNEASKGKENETLRENSTTRDSHCSEENINKNATRRTKRIFSVDDIINNIGNHKNKSKAGNHLSERRHSLQITREFLEREIDTSYMFSRKCPPISESCTDTTKEETEEVMRNMEQHVLKVEEVIPKEETVEKIKEEKFNVTVEEPLDIIDKELSTEQTIDEHTEAIGINEKMLGENQRNDESENVEVAYEQSTESKTIHANKIEETHSEEQVTISQNEALEIADKATQDSLEFYSKENTVIEQKTSQNGVEHKEFCPVDDADNTISCIMKEHEGMSEETNLCNNSIEISDLNIKETTTDSTSQNEVQYRNAIRVEENSVLLEIAGELVDITVNVINGKKVITVLPLSESTVVDFNDNYETLNTTKEETICDPIETNCIDDEQVSQMFAEEEAHSEPDVIESTSEIIIGLDISLEEEIKLDLETPQSMSPKVTKKTYENDLQIPSITTSEDITDNNKANSYSPNDKVSSSKEQTSENFENKKASNTVRKSLKKKLKQSESVLKESMKARKVKKDVASQDKEKTEEADEEEFIPFRDLIKARKLKKIKQQQMKTDDNISADSTNRLDQEESSETESESKLKECKAKSEEVKDKRLPKEDNVDHIGHVKSDKSEEVSEESKSKDAFLDCHIEIDMEKLPKLDEIQKFKDIQFQDTVDKADKLNRRKELSEKVPKKVTFGNVIYDKPQKSTFAAKKVEDPTLKSRPSGGILVPTVSELLKEHHRLPNRKKLSLAEYNSRKRKLIVNDDDNDAKVKKAEPPPEPITIKIDMKRPKEQPCSRFKMQRPKSLDDINIFGKPKEYSQIKRKFSLEVTSSKPNCFDWEETQSPKTNSTPTEETQKRLSEFRGLINNNKSKIIVAMGDFKSTSMENSEDEILQNYKEQVDSKLSSLNLQIPRAAKPPTNILNPFSSAETTSLMKRFLKNEKLSVEEMDKIKKIISYKRLMQQLDRIQSPALNSPLNPSYEIRNCVEKEMKLHLKKVPEKKKKRFRNLYTESTSETDSDFSESKRANGDYSVVQSNCYAAGVPKLIIKRKTEVPVPVVRLERLDMKVLTTRKRKFC